MRLLLRILLTWLFKIKLIGFEKMNFSGPTIILPNHVSFLDAIFLYAFLPKGVCFVINTGISEKLGFILNYIDHITVDPLNPYSLKTIVGIIKTGKTVVIFPEGRITTTGSLMRVYSGIGFIAQKTGAAVYPMIFSGLQYSKLSYITDKVKATWFPQVSMYVDEVIYLEASGEQNAKNHKQEISDKILMIMQHAMFKAKQHGDQEINLFNELVKAGQLHGMNKIMAEDINGKITYKKTIMGSYILGEKFRKIFTKEEIIGVLLPNSIGHVVTLFALCYSNKTPGIFNFSAGSQNNIDCGETAGIKTILTSRAFVEKAKFEEYIDQLATRFSIIYLEDIKATVSMMDKITSLVKYLCKAKPMAQSSDRVILFTSGSESKPKGVVLPQSSIKANLDQIACVIDYTAKDKMMNALPMFHSFGLTAGTLLPIVGGMEVFLYPSPLHYKVIPEISYDRSVTILLGTPTFLMGYGKHAHNYDFYSVRYALAGGEKLKDEVRTLWQEKFGIRIFEGYGTTEMSPVISLNTPLFNRIGTVGKFLPGIEWKTEAVDGILGGGNLLIKGANAMNGYLLHDQGFVPKEEWYNCGDVVQVDEDGFITIKSRLKRFAKISGEMVSLDAVERAAEECFGIDGNAAINVSDDKKGERIVLYTMHGRATKQLLREYFSQSKQSMIMMPAEIYIVEELPLLGSGKIDYVKLKAMNAQRSDQDGY